MIRHRKTWQGRVETFRDPRMPKDVCGIIGSGKLFALINAAQRGPVLMENNRVTVSHFKCGDTLYQNDHGNGEVTALYISVDGRKKQETFYTTEEKL
jgi:hypothetical protein